MAKPGFVLNLVPQHQFSALQQWPEAQLLLLVPQQIWTRARLYVPEFEEVTSAGRFGASPGQFEWELLEQPQGFKWWRRTVRGDATYCGVVVTADPAADPLEVYGMIDIGSDGAWWYDAVELSDPLEYQSEIIARRKHIPVETARLELSLEEYRRRDLLTSEPGADEAAWRIGDEAEVVRLKDALIKLFEQARTATMP